MKFVFPIAALFSVVFLFLYLPLFAEYTETLELDFEQYKLDKSLELSTRAAAQNGIEHGLVQFERQMLREVEFNTNVVLTTYAQFMCFNYDLLPTEENQEFMLRNSVLLAVGGRGFSVTQREHGDFYIANDGALKRVYGSINPNLQPWGDSSELEGTRRGFVPFNYLEGGHVEFDTDSFGTVDPNDNPLVNKSTPGIAKGTGEKTLFGPYIPFNVTVSSHIMDPNNRDVTTRIVAGSILPNAVTFPMLHIVRDSDDYSIVRSFVTTEYSLPSPVTTARIQTEALALMTRAFAQAWNQMAIMGEQNKQLVLPNTVTNVGVSNAAHPGVMALIDGFDYATDTPLRSEAFTGYKVILRREIVAFTDEVGSHWYCYRDQFDANNLYNTERDEEGNIISDGMRVRYTFMTMQEAAQYVITDCNSSRHGKCYCAAGGDMLDLITQEWVDGELVTMLETPDGVQDIGPGGQLLYVPHCHYQPHLGLLSVPWNEN